MRIETNRHIDEEEIERYSMGAMPEADSSRLEEHLLTCESCQTLLTETDRYVSTMQFASAKKRRETQKSKSFWAGFSTLAPTFATGAVLLVLAVAGLRMANRTTASPAFPLNLVATRGNGIEARAPAGRALTLQLELAGLRSEPFFRLEVVDRLGKRVWQGDAVPTNATAAASVPQMARGIYYVRAYSPSGELLREFGLEVENR